MSSDHRCSTRMLIHRFESMSSSSDTDLLQLQFQVPSTTTIVSPVRSTSAHSCAKLDASISVEKEKDKSPIRQSIRNLLSVFSSKKHGSTKPLPNENTHGIVLAHGAEKSLPSIPRQVSDHYLSVDGRQGQDDTTRPHVARGITGILPRVTLFDAPVPPIPPDQVLPNLSMPRKHQGPTKMCGVLLYLSYYENTFISPAWIPCTVTLEADDQTIVVSWVNPEAHSSSQAQTHTITLARCTDVRSLVGDQLDQHDMDIPISGCKEGLLIEHFKVFELLFEGRQREKFAAKTVRERARWVSAIWDTVLPSQNGSASQCINQPEQQLDSAVESNATPAMPAVVPVGAPQTTEPQQDLPQREPRPSTPASISVYAPTKALSRFSTSHSETPDRCHSPSIMNLNQMSKVKQRLAQIKDTELQRKSLSSSISNRTASLLRRWSGAQNPPPATKLEVPKQIPLEDKKDSAPKKDEETSSSFVAAADADKHADVSEAHGQRNASFEPLLDFIKDRAQEHREQVGHLGDQLACIQDEIQRLPQEFYTFVGSPPTPENAGPDIQQMVTKVERKVEAATDVLGAVEDRLEIMSTSMQKQAQARQKSALETLRALDGFRMELGSDFSAIMERLAILQETHERSEKAKQRAPLAEHNKQLPHVIDLSTVLAKLDAVMALQRKAATSVGKAAGKGAMAKVTDVTSKDVKEELSKISSMLEQNNRVRNLHSQQQADSVRYLTELNNWLEAFVNHGTSQIEGVAANVELLCKGLGCSDQPGSTVGGHASLLQDLRDLVANAQAREQSSTELHKSISALLALVNAPTGSGLGSVVDAMEHQRTKQTDLFKAMTQELSSEIKGERIRFVEAMKEATTINIQMQVDSFKQNLAAEVMKMSQEIGRLHQEKRAVEIQIQDLLAFQDKQRIPSQMIPSQASFRQCVPHAG